MANGLAELDIIKVGNYNVNTLNWGLVMRLELTRIGNSRGIRIPKPLIVQCGFGDTVELQVVPEGLVISPHRSPRRGWREAFAALPNPGNDLLLSDVPANAFDRKEWKW